MSTVAKPLAHFVPKYELDYQEAQKLYQAGKYREAREMIEYNLTDPTLPRYWKIRNHVLRAHVADRYDEAEEHRLIAEKVYQEADELTPKSADNDQAALQMLRLDLDDIARYQQEDYEDLFGSDNANDLQTGVPGSSTPPSDLALALRGKPEDDSGKRVGGEEGGKPEGIERQDRKREGVKGGTHVQKKASFDLSEYLDPEGHEAIIGDPRSLRRKKNAASRPGLRSLFERPS